MISITSAQTIKLFCIMQMEKSIRWYSLKQLLLISSWDWYVIGKCWPRYLFCFEMLKKLMIIVASTDIKYSYSVICLGIWSFNRNEYYDVYACEYFYDREKSWSQSLTFWHVLEKHQTWFFLWGSFKFSFSE